MNDSINDKNFPYKKTEGKVELIDFKKSISTDDALKEMDERGLRPATIHETLQWAKKNWNGKDWIIPLGSVWQDLGGSRFCPYLDGSGSSRGLGLYWFDSDWGEVCRFACVKKNNATNVRVSEPSEVKERILSRVSDWKECWVYNGAKRKGYGLIRVNGTQQTVHCVLYEIMSAPIPTGYVLDHLCKNKGCVNPAHLQPVTSRENTMRGNGPTALRAKQTHCKNGHELSGDNLIARKDARRVCKTCNRERMRKEAA